MKRSPMPPRKTRLVSKTRPNRRNAKRRQTEFARCYHSRERVAWVQSLGCVICDAKPSQNAHVEADGMGRKAAYDRIAPLCARHHKAYDEYQSPFKRDSIDRDFVKFCATRVEELWRLRQQQRGEQCA